MNDNEIRLQGEVQELKAEVRRLRRAIKGVFIMVGLISAVICPQLLFVVAIVALLILFAFLVSPVRRMIFSSIFQTRDGHEYDA